jgi:hypothetical protein
MSTNDEYVYVTSEINKRISLRTNDAFVYYSSSTEKSVQSKSLSDSMLCILVLTSESIDFCLGLNSGECLQLGNGFICSCPTTFVGNRCEAPGRSTSRIYTHVTVDRRILVVARCQTNPCRNGAACIPAGTCTSFSCLLINELTLVFFFFFLFIIIAYLCQCPLGFYGTLCEFRNYCLPNPCANNGLCTQTITGYICSCLYPYTGSNCQTRTSTCSSNFD